MFPNTIQLLMEFLVVPLHKHPELTPQCCSLINSEWSRSETARLRSLQSSCDSLPVNLILLQTNQVLGHAKLSQIPSIKKSCFIESVVIDKKFRGLGLGRLLMTQCEQYCRDKLDLNAIYLSTKGQERFYEKLGYEKCAPVSIYGGAVLKKIDQCVVINTNVGPAPPLLPTYCVNQTICKTYMWKNIVNNNNLL